MERGGRERRQYIDGKEREGRGGKVFKYVEMFPSYHSFISSKYLSKS